MPAQGNINTPHTRITFLQLFINHITNRWHLHLAGRNKPLYTCDGMVRASFS